MRRLIFLWAPSLRPCLSSLGKSTGGNRRTEQAASIRSSRGLTHQIKLLFILRS